MRMVKLALAAVCILSVSPVPSVALADTLELRADVWCPTNCEPGAKLPGYMLEIAQAAFEKSGHKISYKVMPWARTLEETRNGTILGAIGAAKSDAPDFVFPEEPLGEMKNCLYTRTDSKIVYKNPSSLSSIKLGAIKDYSYGEDVDKYIADNAKNPDRIDFVSGDAPLEKNVRKLLAKRLDGFMESSQVAQLFLSTLKEASQIREAGCGPVDFIYIGFSPKNPKSKEYAAILAQGVRDLRKSGKLKEILTKYGLKDWKK